MGERRKFPRNCNNELARLEEIDDVDKSENSDCTYNRGIENVDAKHIIGKIGDMGTAEDWGPSYHPAMSILLAVPRGREWRVCDAATLAIQKTPAETNRTPFVGNSAKTRTSTNPVFGA